MRLPLPRELHTSERPSSTAQWTTLIRALELQRPPAERIVSDDFAPVFLSSASRAVLAPLKAGAPVVHLLERHDAVGLASFVLFRHAMIDEHLADELDQGAEQLLVLGAGYDSRAYRFAGELAGRPVFEVDLPPLSQRKAGIVAAHPDLFGGNSIHRVEINFRTQSLEQRLRESGFPVGARTYVVWEGVSPYLSADAVEATLATLRGVCGPGSVLAMDVWSGSAGGGALGPVRTLGAKAFGLVGEPLAWGISPDRVGEFLHGHGFDVFDLAGARELVARYSTAGRTSEKTVYVLTARLQ